MSPFSTEPTASPAPASPLARMARRVTLGVALLVAAVLTGFAAFLFSLERAPETLPAADGIVVLTGAPDRIADATLLLTQQRGRRLLITGVHPDTTLTEISRTVPATEEALKCCVELGRSALNTRGNAIETAAWARANGFHSLIVVTSAWHMPRALVELGRALPETRLIPYPVVSRSAREANWQGRLGSIRLLFLEYCKFLAAYVGIGIWPAVTSEIGAAAPSS